MLTDAVFMGDTRTTQSHAAGGHSRNAGESDIMAIQSVIETLDDQTTEVCSKQQPQCESGQNAVCLLLQLIELCFFGELFDDAI